MENKSEMINRIAELAEENAELKKYIERMDKPEIQVIDAEILTLKEENAKLNAIIDGYQPKIQALKEENERLKEEILKFRWDNPYFDLYNNVVNQRDMWEQKSEQYKSCLQEIKKIAEYIMTSDTEKWTLDEPFKQIEKILELTKAEEE